MIKYLQSIIIIVFILFVSNADYLIAQEPQAKWTLSSPPADNQTYVARDYVSLQPGFSYSATGNNKFVAKIDEYLVFPPSDKTYATPAGAITSSPEQGGVVGTIPGQFSLSPTGAATYSIPIEVPNGINGMQPNISLVYNSQAGNGIAGWGWNIGGISMISRVPKNLYFDNSISGIDWSQSSPLALDGQRLIKISDSEYRTESETFSKITAENIQSWGPTVIKVQTKAGLIMEYGQQGSAISYAPISNGKQLGWLLSKVYDQFGNYIKYNYSYGAGVTYKDLVLQSVAFGSSSREIGKVNFSYRTRSDLIEGYVDGTLTRNNRLLDRIDVYSNGSLQRKYELKYSYADIYSQLTEVGLKNASGEQFNPTIVKWKKYDQSYSKVGSEDFSFLSNNVSERPIYGDFNGDGRRDFITYKEGLVTLYINYDLWGTVNFSKEYEFTILGDKPKGIIPADLNGDGKLDLIAITQAYKSYRYNYYFSDGKSFSNGGGSGYKGFNTTEKDNDFVIGDFDGDGRQDVLIKSTAKAYNSAGSVIGSGGISDWGRDLFSIFPNSRFLFDFTGNGKTNICILDDSQARVYELINGGFVMIYATTLVYNELGILPGDYNSDGKTDLFIQKVNSSAPDGNDYYILFATGNSFVKKDLPNLQLSDKTFAADFNLDGKGDLVVCKPDYTNASSYEDVTIKFSIGVYNGSTFTFEDYSSNMPYFYYAGGYKKASLIYVDVADYSGDGRMEICYDRYADTRFIKSFNDANHLYISEIRDGLGESIQLKIDPITSYIYSESGNTYSYPIVSPRIPLYVVSNAYFTGSIYKNVNYYYKDILIHKQGKGLLGFQSVREKESYSGIEVETINKLNTYFYSVVPYIKETRYGSNTIISRTESNTSLVYLGPKRFIPRITSVIEENKLSNTTVTNSLSNYDSYGNPKSISTNYGDGIVETKTFTYTTAGSWCPNQIATISVTKTNNNGSESFIDSYTYYNNGKLHLHTANPGEGDFEIVSEYQYDDFGNVTSETVASGSDSRSIIRTYSSTGRFLETETNSQLKETITYNFDETKGTLLSKTTPVGTTNYEYDGFGRLLKTSYPDKNRSVIARQWAGGVVTGAKYYIYEETSGSGPLKTWYDSQGRELRKDYYGLGGKEIHIKTEYNSKGQLYRQSDPYIGSAPTQWSVTFLYDNYGRKMNEVTPLGTTSYVYDGLKTTITSPSGKVETILNSAGQIITSKEDGKTVNFSYYPSGQVKSATPEGGNPVSYKYDLLGNRIEINDPDAGVVTTVYNGFGELLEQSRKIHIGQEAIKTTYAYDSVTKLLKTVTTGAQSTSYTYDTRNRLKTETINGVHSRSYDYDSFNRPVKTTETITGKPFITSTAYDVYGRVQEEVYPTGYATINTYDDYGHLITITDSKSVRLWEASEADAFGRLTKYKQGGRTTSMAYHEKTGLPTSIVANNILSMSYDYDAEGLLQSRYDYITDQEEVFSYDGQNRLAGWTLHRGGSAAQTYSMSYDAVTGGIKTKPSVGYTMAYGGDETPLHALSSVSGTPQALTDHAPQTIDYNDYNKVSRINQGTMTHSITYGVARQRVKSTFTNSGNTTLTKYYLGNYEEEHLADGKIRKLHYIHGGNGLAAIYVQNSNVDTLYYTYSDYQGNLLAVTDVSGTVKERYAYDPWGLRKNPTNWSQLDSRPSFLFSRGYTLHEHLDGYGLINMNGRVYDPLMGQFLSPDPYIQSPGSWLNYNRYGYALNNPLIYTDPSGEFFWVAFAIGAAIGGYTGYKIADAKGYDMGDLQTYGYMLGGAAIGGFSGALGAEIAAGGGFMANTSAMIYSSYSYSMGMSALSGGMIQPSVNFGFGSYNFGTGEFNYLFDGDNKWYEDLGYGLGAIANVSDILRGFHNDNILGQTENTPDAYESGKDKIGHYQLLDKDGNSLVDFGPGQGGDFYKFKTGRNNWTEYATSGRITQTKDIPGNIFNTSQTIKGVNLNILQKYSNWLDSKPGFYNFALRSCSTQAARGLTLSGVPVFGIHPYLLRFQIVNGLRPYMFNYTYTNGY